MGANLGQSSSRTTDLALGAFDWSEPTNFMQADALLSAGDMEGSATWHKVIKAIEVMQATETSGVVH